MPIYNDIFSINQVYELMVDGEWVTSAYVPPTPYGWVAGGYGSPRLSTVERINFTSDTSALSTRGSLTTGTMLAGSVESNTSGYIFGGNGDTAILGNVQKINFSTDTSATTTVSTMPVALYGVAGKSNQTFGWYSGGTMTGNTTTLSTISRITFSSDTTAPTNRTTLVTSRRFHAATGNNDFAWFSGGILSPGPGLITATDRLVYASDTAATTTRGSTVIRRYSLAGSTDNSSYGWVAGGYNPSAPNSLYKQSIVERINYSADTVAAEIRGPLVAASYKLSATGTSSFGWFFGGDGYPSYISTIQRITYSNDTATSETRNSLSGARYGTLAVYGSL